MALAKFVAQLIHVDPDICHVGPCCGADINVQKASEMIQVFARSQCSPAFVGHMLVHLALSRFHG